MVPDCSPIARGLVRAGACEQHVGSGASAGQRAVSNAVRHGCGRITLRAQLRDGRLLVEVIDEGQGFERELRERDFERSGTRSWGSSIVDTESSRWGIGRGTTRVWFELDRWELRLETTGE